ncbi:hypothetical protein [Calderihabitans maritimus]|uniref:Uncharacterized protein n=1 Tax=Calderihabitans maritimus TaxID=1246530 RepID=A0A1Z5HWC9_9FIRM|nr:hypothetical protein [Calderihabitans maritimus]GAW93657.1 hypothetical protein DESME_07560 [Calderihabitans maritimus]
MPKKYYLKYGGIRFTAKVPPQDINRFVQKLPEEKSSLYEVAKELADKGLIEIHQGEFSSIDQDMLPYQR